MTIWCLFGLWVSCRLSQGTIITYSSRAAARQGKRLQGQAGQLAVAANGLVRCSASVGLVALCAMSLSLAPQTGDGSFCNVRNVECYCSCYVTGWWAVTIMAPVCTACTNHMPTLTGSLTSVCCMCVVCADLYGLGGSSRLQPVTIKAPVRTTCTNSCQP
jgi:hypothetical protein